MIYMLEDDANIRNFVLYALNNSGLEALARKKAEGVILGRPKGKKNAPDKYKLSGKENLIRELLQVGVSKRKIAKICKVDRNTLSRFINDRIEA